MAKYYPPPTLPSISSYTKLFLLSPGAYFLENNMDETLKKQLKKTILKTISNGIAFNFMTVEEREQKEYDLVQYLKDKGYEVLIENCMIFVLSSEWERIMILELTRNTLYFTPTDMTKAIEVVYYALQFTAKDYLEVMFSKESIPKKVKKQEEIEVDPEEEEETEDDKPTPSFDFL